MTDNYHSLWRGFLIRLCFAGPLFVFGIILLIRGARSTDVGAGFIACALILIAAVVLAFPIAGLLAERTGGLFWPGRRLDRPLPMYSIPQAKRTQGLYEEAIALYEKIAEDYPRETQPYIDMIDICIVNLKDPNRAYVIYDRGMQLLKKDKDKEALTTMYKAISTRLGAKMSN